MTPLALFVCTALVFAAVCEAWFLVWRLLALVGSCAVGAALGGAAAFVYSLAAPPPPVTWAHRVVTCECRDGVAATATWISWADCAEACTYRGGVREYSAVTEP